MFKFFNNLSKTIFSYKCIREENAFNFCRNRNIEYQILRVSNLVPFVQFKKREKHPCRNVKVKLLHKCFSRFFKLYKWYQIAQRTTYLDPK